MPAAASRGPSANASGLPVEERLVDYIDQLDRHRKGGRAIRLHLSLLGGKSLSEAA